MTAPLELWGGHECTVNRVGAHYMDQTRLTGHQDRIEDLDRFAELGLKALRYPVLWERTEVKPGVYDWSWADARLERLRALGIRPIVGLLHHGSGPVWTDLLDPDFAVGLARFAGAVAERYPWVRDWTPVNEPLTTARFSALYGFWHPHLRDEAALWLALLNQIDATRLAMEAIRAVNPDARLIQTEDFGHTYSTEPCGAQAAFENRRRLLTWDLLCGRVDEEHPLRARLEKSVPASRLDALVDAPCPPDVVGVNYYVTSDRFLDHRMDRYPLHAWGGNETIAYADVEAVRVVAPTPVKWGERLGLLWRRYGIPLAVTECHLGCTSDEQMRWLAECWRTATQLKARGVAIEAVTVWALLGGYDWDSLLTFNAGRYESGVFDVSADHLRPTELTGLVQALAASDEIDHSAATQAGWWRRDERLIYPVYSKDSRYAKNRPQPVSGPEQNRQDRQVYL